jgi:hypothetical protein
VCNDIEKERDPQQQVFYQTIKTSQASRPSSARSQAESGALRVQVVPSLAVESIASDTTTWVPLVHTLHHPPCIIAHHLRRYQAAYSARSAQPTLSPQSPSGGFTPRFLRNEQVRVRARARVTADRQSGPSLLRLL